MLNGAHEDYTNEQLTDIAGVQSLLTVFFQTIFGSNPGLTTTNQEGVVFTGNVNTDTPASLDDSSGE